MAWKNISTFGFLTCVQFAMGSAMAASNDPCDSLIQDKRVVGIQIVANGFTGWLGGVTGQGTALQQGLQVKRLPNGTIQFEGQALFDGEAVTKISGSCKDRRIQFTRSGNRWMQSYTGFLYEKIRPVGQEMSGLFGPLVLVNLKPKVNQQFGWCAHMVSIEQVY